MTGNLDMNNKQINNLPLPTGTNQPTTKGFTDLAYLHFDGTVPMGGNLNMNNKKITYLLYLRCLTQMLQQKSVLMIVTT